MFKTKLFALGYKDIDKFSVYNRAEFGKLIIWLEDQFIQYYPIQERAGLRAVMGIRWENEFLSSYLKDIGCPYSYKGERAKLIDWILLYSIRLAYADDIYKFKSLTSDNVKELVKKGPQVILKNPLDNIDFDSTEFQNHVKSLCQLLNVVYHPDHLVTTKALCTVIKRHFSKQAVAKAKTQAPGAKPFPLHEMPSAVKTSNPKLDEIVKVMNLLYINDLRSLESSINECIVAVQAVTADPKTDTKLGKVGQ